MPFDPLKPLTQIVYQEEMFSDTLEFKQSHDAGKSTLARVEIMKVNGLIQGKFITFKSRAHDAESQYRLFSQPNVAKKENLPVIKMSELKPLNLEPLQDA